MAAAAAKGGPNAAMAAFDDNLDRVVSWAWCSLKHL